MSKSKLMGSDFLMETLGQVSTIGDSVVYKTEDLYLSVEQFGKLFELIPKDQHRVLGNAIEYEVSIEIVETNLYWKKVIATKQAKNRVIVMPVTQETGSVLEVSRFGSGVQIAALNEHWVTKLEESTDGKSLVEKKVMVGYLFKLVDYAPKKA